MLACLLAALMSSVDAYMIIGSALVARNVYAPYFNANATEQQYINVARWTGLFVVAGGVIVSLFLMDVFKQLQLTWVFNVLFAAPFWVGMWWRRATTSAAWITVIFNVMMFFGIPFFAPLLISDLRDNPKYLITNQIIETTTKRKAAPTDVSKRNAEMAKWGDAQATLQDAEVAFQMAFRQVSDAGSADLSALKDIEASTAKLIEAQGVLDALGDRPTELQIGDMFPESKTAGGKGVFWPGGVKPVDDEGNVITSVKPVAVGDESVIDENTKQQVLAYPEGTKLRGLGNFQLDYFIYQAAGIDLTKLKDAVLDTLSLPAKIIAPFLVMILFSFITPANSKEALDRYYAKMKTPVDPDHETDRKNLEEAFNNLDALEQKKLLPGSSLEMQKPTRTDVVGFIVCFLVCFAVIGLAWGITKIQ
jgi:SSS family solute:Na+ symporter